MSTENIDLVHIARQLNLIWGNFARLGMTHLIPAERLHKRYLLRFCQDMATSEAIFASWRSRPVPEAIGGMRPPSTGPLDSGKYMAYYRKCGQAA